MESVKLYQPIRLRVSQSVIVLKFFCYEGCLCSHNCLIKLFFCFGKFLGLRSNHDLYDMQFCMITDQSVIRE